MNNKSGVEHGKMFFHHVPTGYRTRMLASLCVLSHNKPQMLKLSSSSPCWMGGECSLLLQTRSIREEKSGI